MTLAASPFLARVEDADFEVEEIGVGEPSGEGEHLLLWIEKRGLSTDAAAARLARALGRSPGDAGWAGRKDKRAVTRQWISVAGARAEDARELGWPDLSVLRAAAHAKKLKPGMLRGNRFRLRLRAVDTDRWPRAKARLVELERDGLPNAFGPQRFGAGGDGAELGLALLERRFEDYVRALCTPPHAPDTPAVAELGERLADGRGLRSTGSPAARLPAELAAVARQLARRRGDWASAARAVGRRLCLLHLSALQASVFGDVLARRSPRPGAPEEGDLTRRHRPPSPFEESATGPLVGWKAPLATGRPGSVERAVLAERGIDPAAFQGILPGLSPRGARRALRVPLTAVELRGAGDERTLAFELPAGAYATVVLDELLNACEAPGR
ncbi:MAG: tRNA pseudouridine(13) synthase TruD [Planctomycetota bacterium]|nr:tRNA pseudouridine(13) synthase TruD [Planctomycetota bacterium]MDP6761431.1 tRNA pseudouridine(13) synthase TruD [Planctomycetota bacterium]